MKIASSAKLFNREILIIRVQTNNVNERRIGKSEKRKRENNDIKCKSQNGHSELLFRLVF